jgi:hypothetical protein
MKVIFLCVLIFISNILESQSIEISLSLSDSCVDISKQTIAIQIYIRNNTNKDIWVDLEAIKYKIYNEDIQLSPFEVSIIGVYSPRENISQDGFVLVKKKRDILVFNNSNILKNYKFDKNQEYCLKGYYNNARNKMFKMIFNNNIDIGKIVLKICE